MKGRLPLPARPRPRRWRIWGAQTPPPPGVPHAGLPPSPIESPCFRLQLIKGVGAKAGGVRGTAWGRGNGMRHL